MLRYVCAYLVGVFARWDIYDTEQPAMPYANHDQCHQSNCTSVTENVDENLRDWLAYGACDCSLEILDGE